MTTGRLLVTAWIPLQAPSMNSLLYVLWHQKRMEVRPEVRQFRSQFKAFLPVWTLEPGPYSLELDFSDSWYTQSGTPKRKDMPNLLKACIDALAEHYGFEDSLIWNLMARKVDQEQLPGIRLTLRSLNVEPTACPTASGTTGTVATSKGNPERNPHAIGTD